MEQAEEEEAMNVLDGQEVIDDALQDIAQDQEVGEEEAPKKTTKYPRPLPPKPKIIYEKPPEIPVEITGVGVNKKVVLRNHDWYQ